MNFLTETELQELTGRERPSAQIRWLEAQEPAWPYIPDADGRPKVSRSYFNGRTGGSIQKDDFELVLKDEKAA